MMWKVNLTQLKESEEENDAGFGMNVSRQRMCGGGRWEINAASSNLGTEIPKRGILPHTLRYVCAVSDEGWICRWCLLFDCETNEQHLCTVQSLTSNETNHEWASVLREKHFFVRNYLAVIRRNCGNRNSQNRMQIYAKRVESWSKLN